VTWKKSAADRRRDSQRYGAAWRRARKAALERAGHRCEIRTEACTGRATQVDHVNGAENDPEHRHLRAACAPCHRKVTAQQGGGYRRSSRKADPAPLQNRTWW
jgi:5-methylcytosine-specific restriction endonuclease McrA